MATKNIDLCLLYIFPILSYIGFYYVGFDVRLWKMLWLITVPLFFIYVFKTIVQQRVSPLFKSMRLFLVAEIVSIFMAYLLWGQSLVLTYRAMMNLWSILYFFFLVKTGFEKKQLEWYVWINIGLYLVLWLYALSQVPITVFGYDMDKEIDDARGFFRIDIANRGCVYLGLFMALNKWKENKRKIWILVAAGCFLLVVLMLTRQSIALSVVVAGYYLFRRSKHILIYLFLLSFIAFCFVNAKFAEDSVLGALITLSKQQMEEQKSGNENIRFSEFRYYTTEYTHNVVGYLLGNGTPHYDSSYGKYELKLQKVHEYYGSDVGWAWFFAQFGLLGIFAMAKIFWHGLRKKVPRDMEYAKYFLGFLGLYHIASNAIVTDMIYFCIAIYLIDCLAVSKKAINLKFA